MSGTPTQAEVDRTISASTTLGSARTREGLLGLLTQAHESTNEWIRRQVLNNDRIDILAEQVLGYDIHPNIHFPLVQHQLSHTESLTLIFRGAGKTTIGTIAFCIWLILKDPNIRILLASKVASNAEDMLSEIKGHFETNERLREIFGEYVGDRQWDAKSIEVMKRTAVHKEPTIMTVGVGTAVASKHYDIAIGDDLVDEENSRTAHQRSAIKTWYYKTFLPCIMPPDDVVPLRGRVHVLGTRYHYDDLYGWLLTHEMKRSTLTIPSLDEKDESNYPERFPTEFLHKKRENAGVIIFNSQFQCSTDAMRGDIFEFDDCDVQPITAFPPPESMSIGIGVDLAIGRKSTNDYFAVVVVGETEDEHLWVLDFLNRRLRFGDQPRTVETYYERWERWLRCCTIEAVAYQAVLPELLKDKHKDWLIRPYKTHKDKITRAHKLSPLFEQHRIHFRPDQHAIIDQLVTFPHGDHDDLFDALDLAIAGLRLTRRRSMRIREEPGLL